MKKIFILSFLSAICTDAFAATQWWLQPTVCRLDPTKCYTSMGAGYDTEYWDATSGCWGMKLICGDALISPRDEPTPVGRADISGGTMVKSDFDPNVLNGDCFGVRKTTSGGTMVLVNGKYVNVWCNGILDHVDENLPNGEITYGTQPTCDTLARDGYVAVVNNRCFGKYFDTEKYFIECGADITPSRLIILNGADANGTSTAPVDQAAADRIFDTMYQRSQEQHKKYFK